MVEQIRILNNKWDPENPNCVFQYYFYNSVKPEEAPFYGPSLGEDERKWEEALSNKPSSGAIPGGAAQKKVPFGVAFVGRK